MPTQTQSIRGAVAQDPYTELGVPRAATADEIRKSFRKLAKIHHPDKNPGDKKSEEKFKRVTAAFDILGDEDKRRRFDRGEIDADGHEVQGGFRPSGGGSPFSGGAGAPGRGDFEGVNFEDMLGEMFSRQGAGGAGAGRGFSGRGSDIRARLDIDLEDAIRGASRRITFGDGRALEVSIPKGAAEGQVLRLRGQGHAGRTGPGDALIELAIKEHPIYRRDGADLHMDLPISVPDAVLGAKIDTPTPDGVVALSVPKRSNSGAVLRLKGRGAIDAATGRRGDLLARLMVVLPEAPDGELDRIAEIWRKERPYTPRRRT